MGHIFVAFSEYLTFTLVEDMEKGYDAFLISGQSGALDWMSTLKFKA